MHLGIIGFGNIGQTLLKLLEDDPVERITLLVRSSAQDSTGDVIASSRATSAFEIVSDADALAAASPDLVIECAGQTAVAEIVPALLRNGVATVVVSIGALADLSVKAELRQAAEHGAAKLILPAGAIGGIDLLSALAPAGDLRVTYRGTKPPAAWRGTPAETAIDLDNLTEATVFFAGSARDAARSYPKNANVAATLALAGAGWDETRVELIADPSATSNQHAYEVSSPLCRYSMTIDGSVSQGNAKTSVTTVYSVLREINRARRSVVV